ncbi:unnamed protein product, partial [Staurois parvus]
LTTSRPAVVYKRPDGGSAGGGLPFINRAHHFGVCSLPGSNRHRTPITVRDLLITRIGVSKMSLLTSLLTMCEICE